jgi:hypothetical protein
MNQPSPHAVEEDKAWVVIQTPLRIEELQSFCSRIEHLFRINPYLEIMKWRQTAPDHFHVELRNLSNKRDVVNDIALERETTNIFRVRYREGIKRYTEVRLEPLAEGSRLTITDNYGGFTTEERQAREAEVDKSLNAWGHALYVFFRRWNRWRWIAPWRWYMQRVWMPMKPSARRIAWMLILITIVEFFFFLFVLLIYLIEHNW